MLGLLRRTCPLLSDTNARRTLYLFLVKSQLSYATEVWSPSLFLHKSKLERVQRRASRRILKCSLGGLSYKERLLALKILPLCYDREIRDLCFFYKALHGLTDINVYNFVTFINHNRTRCCKNPALMLKVPFCKTSTFRASYFNRIVPLWNVISKIAAPENFSSLSRFKRFLLDTYFSLLTLNFDVDMMCTWSLYRNCSCHQ